MRFDVLGPLQVIRDGELVESGGFKQRSLLALLLIHRNEVVSSDRIIDELWGDDASSDHRGALWVHLSNLRSALEPDRSKGSTGSVLLTRSPGYLLAVGDNEIDVGEFEHLLDEGRSLLTTDPAAASLVLAESLELWRGRPYEDFTYESFAQTEIARLGELRMEGVESRIEADLRSGLDRELIGELEALTREHPLRESLVAKLMTALYKAGRQSEALRSYRALEGRLAEELGIEPSSELKELEESILIGDPFLQEAAPAPGGRGPATGLGVRGYELREEIGSGPSGTVYRGFQPTVGREVAVKVFRQELANDPDFIRRFEATMRVVAGLGHPHIVPIYDYWREPDRAYLVMPLMKGGSLGDRIEDDLVAPGAAGEVVAQVAAALDTTHRQGITHGDLKPSNLLFDAEGVAYLSDFGVIAPMKSRGDAGGVDEGGDVYSLGEVLRQILDDSSPAEMNAIAAKATSRDPSEHYSDIETFASELQEALGTSANVVASHPKNPYKGLHAFDETDAAMFFGRERLTERLIGRLGVGGPKARFVALVGPSGSGKSSVVRAGLLPAVRKGAIPNSEDWFIAEMTPGSHPFAELETALLRVAVDPPPTVLEQLTADRGGLRRIVEQILPADGAQMLLVIDQFEELFTQTAGEDQRSLFLNSVLEAAMAKSGRLRVVATLRADFYDRPLRYQEFGEVLRVGTEVITPMSPEDLERTVAGPAESIGVALEPGLAAAVVADVVDEPSALPLMQYAMTETFERRQGGTLSKEAYRHLGGVAAALGRRAEDLFGSLSDSTRETARQIFLQLISLGDDGGETRRRVLRSQLAGLGSPSSVEAVLDLYGSHRLLTFDRDPVSRSPTVEVAHEALLSEWPRYADWIEEARGDLRVQRRLVSAAREWATHDHDAGYLLLGSRLAEAETWVASTDLKVTPELERYLAASSEHATEQAQTRRRRRRTISSIFAIIGAVAVALLVFGVTQRSAADRLAAIEEINRLIDWGEEALGFDSELALLLGVEAAERGDSLGMEVFPANLELLHRGLRADRLLFTVDDVTAGVFSPDGSLVYAGRPDGTISVLDSTTGDDLSTISVPETDVVPAGLAISEDGRWLTDGRFVIDTLDLTAAEPTWPDGSEFLSIRDVDISADGRLVAVADFIRGGQTGFAAVWDRQTQQEEWRVEAGGPVGVEFHPDGGLLAVASEASAAPPSVLLLDLSSGAIEEIPGSENLRGLAFPPDGGRLLVGEGSIRHWDLDSEAYVDRDGGHGARVNDIEVSEDGALVASGDNDGVLVVRDGLTGTPLFSLPRHESAVGVVEMSGDGERLATTTESALAGVGRLRVFDTSEEGGPDLATIDTALSRLSTVDLHPSGDLVAVGADDIDGSRQVWSLSGGQELELPAHHQLGLPLGVNGPIVYSPDGSTIATADIERVRLWDADTGELVSESSLRQIAPTLGETFGTLAPFGDHILALEYSPDGSRLAMAGSGFVVVADTATLEDGVPIYVHDLGYTDRVAFDVDGTEILAGANPGRQVGDDFTNPAFAFDVETGEIVAEIQTDGVVSTVPVAYSPSGDLAAVAGDGVSVLDAGSYALERELRFGRSNVRDVEFHPTGEIVAAAYASGTIVLWDPYSGDRLYTLPAHEGAAADLDWSDDGSRLVSVGDDGLIRAYLTDTEELVELARSRVTRGLTREECQVYMISEDC